ncbi:hypothetical protein HY637_02065 [Candidatus Woesearchaeota archaeon]|nr:hypothetical protein [Candidatus Woesearchaeota archaeon]
MIKPYAVPLILTLVPTLSSGQEPFPYEKPINFFRREVGFHQDGGRRVMTASIFLDPRIRQDNMPQQLSFLYHPGELNERYFIVCEGISGIPERPYRRGGKIGPLDVGITSAICLIDGGGYGPFDEQELVDAILSVDTRRVNIAESLTPFDGFKKIPPEEQGAATQKAKGILEDMMANWSVRHF